MLESMSEIYHPPRMLARHHQDEDLHFLDRESRTKATHLPRLHQGWGVDPMYGAVLMFFSGKNSALFGLVSYSRGWFLFFNIHPYLGAMIKFDDHIFPMGWFNHQLAFLMTHDALLGGSSQLVSG